MSNSVGIMKNQIMTCNFLFEKNQKTKGMGFIAMEKGRDQHLIFLSVSKRIKLDKSVKNYYWGTLNTDQIQTNSWKIDSLSANNTI
jgi:hypothetical protein